MCVFDSIVVHLTIRKNKGTEQYSTLAGRPKRDPELKQKSPPGPFCWMFTTSHHIPSSMLTELFQAVETAILVIHAFQRLSYSFERFSCVKGRLILRRPNLNGWDWVEVGRESKCRFLKSSVKHESSHQITEQSQKMKQVGLKLLSSFHLNQRDSHTSILYILSFMF